MTERKEQQVEVGQIWRERDSRFVRYVRVLGIEGDYARCVTCREFGAAHESSPRTRIRLSNLRKRFTLSRAAGKPLKV